MENIVSQHISQTIALLNEHADYAVLRNYEGLPDHNNSRDCDIIISRKSLKDVRSLLLKMWADTGWSILVYLNSDRLITFVTARLDGLRLSLMQWDFFVDTSVWGILLMSAEEFLSTRVFNGFLWHVDASARFLDKYLYNRAVGSPYPEKYAAERAAAEHQPAVEAKISEIFGMRTVAEADVAPGRKLLFKALGWNLRHRPFALVADKCRFGYTFAANYCRSCTGFSIGFTGPDGAGKTTVIDGMIAATGSVFAKAHSYLHFRPALFGNIGDVAHRAHISAEPDRRYDKPHRGGRTGTISSLLRLGYYTVDYILGYFLRVKTVTRITRLVIFDRYFTDIICDSRRSRIYLPLRFLYWWYRCLIPTLDYNILLTADTGSILARKAELDAEGIEAINARIGYLAKKKGFWRVTNDTTPEAAVAKIWRIVIEGQDRRNRKRLHFR